MQRVFTNQGERHFGNRIQPLLGGNRIASGAFAQRGFSYQQRLLIALFPPRQGDLRVGCTQNGFVKGRFQVADDGGFKVHRTFYLSTLRLRDG